LPGTAGLPPFISFSISYPERLLKYWNRSRVAAKGWMARSE
jgi:hypothetical protein